MTGTPGLEAEADGPGLPLVLPDLLSGVSYGEVGCGGSLEPEAPGLGACFGCFKIWLKCMNKNTNSGNMRKHRGKEPQEKKKPRVVFVIVFPVK